MNSSIQPQSYGKACDALIQAAPQCQLGPGIPHRETYKQLEALTPSRLLEGRVPADEDMARCCLAGLWLLHNYLDESHNISQHIHSRSGSFWHGVMHRREPDYSNAKYWFRRVGDHPIYPELQAAADQLAAAHKEDPAAEALRGRDTWDPYYFVDLCEEVAHGRSTSLTLCKQLATAEWQLLFDYCYRHLSH